MDVTWWNQAESSSWGLSKMTAIRGYLVKMDACIRLRFFFQSISTVNFTTTIICWARFFQATNEHKLSFASLWSSRNQPRLSRKKPVPPSRFTFGGDWKNSKFITNLRWIYVYVDMLYNTNSHRIHVWDIYLRLVDSYGKWGKYRNQIWYKTIPSRLYVQILIQFMYVLPCSTNSFCICDLIWLKNWQKGALHSFLWYHCLGTCGCEFSNNWLTASVHNFGPTRNTLVWAPLCFVCDPSISITLRHCHNQIGLLRFVQQPLCQVSPFATSCTVPKWILP